MHSKLKCISKYQIQTTPVLMTPHHYSTSYNLHYTFIPKIGKNF